MAICIICIVYLNISRGFFHPSQTPLFVKLSPFPQASHMDSKAASALKDNFAKPQEINASRKFPLLQGGFLDHQGEGWRFWTNPGDQWELTLNFFQKQKTSWWFQPLWNILVKMGTFPK